MDWGAREGGDSSGWCDSLGEAAGDGVLQRYTPWAVTVSKTQPAPTISIYNVSKCTRCCRNARNLQFLREAMECSFFPVVFPILLSGDSGGAVRHHWQLPPSFKLSVTPEAQKWEDPRLPETPYQCWGRSPSRSVGHPHPSLEQCLGHPGQRWCPPHHHCRQTQRPLQGRPPPQGRGLGLQEPADLLEGRS